MFLLNTERAYVWSLRVSTCQSSLFSKHFIGWKTMKVVQSVNYCRGDLQSHLPDNYLTDSFDTWLCLHPFCSKKLFELLMQVYTPCFTLNLQSLWQSMHAWAYVKKHAKYFKWCMHYNAWQCMSFTLTFAWNRDCRMVFKNQFSRLFKTRN